MTSALTKRNHRFAVFAVVAIVVVATAVRVVIGSSALWSTKWWAPPEAATVAVAVAGAETNCRQANCLLCDAAGGDEKPFSRPGTVIAVSQIASSPCRWYILHGVSNHRLRRYSWVSIHMWCECLPFSPGQLKQRLVHAIGKFVAWVFWFAQAQRRHPLPLLPLFLPFYHHLFSIRFIINVFTDFGQVLHRTFFAFVFCAFLYFSSILYIF